MAKERPLLLQSEKCYRIYIAYWYNKYLSHSDTLFGFLLSMLERLEDFISR